VQKEAIAKLSDKEVIVLKHDWGWYARPSQQMPKGNWRTWLILAGRGYGKTRTGAETVREWVKKYPIVNLIGATASDARDIMIEGESGILAICPKWERPVYVASKRQLVWPNGAKSLVFTADEPERLRGKQSMKLWADELGSWRYEESWDQAMFGLRLGQNPQAVVTTTPRPTKLVKALVANPTTHVTRGSTYDNRSNLAAAFFEEIIKKYEGTRLGRQELMAELLMDNPGALWHQGIIDDLRVNRAPAFKRIVTAIDPSVAKFGEKDECGIIVVGEGVDNHFYPIDDLSGNMSPDTWAKRAVEKGHRAHMGDKIVAETNNGGALVESVLRTIDPNIPYQAVTASRGKRIRAEPIAALYEQGRVHHIGMFAKLEDEMCNWDPSVDTKSPNRLDALVWGISALIDPSISSGLSFGGVRT
jgi:phage terminase large subunit-like protein